MATDPHARRHLAPTPDVGGGVVSVHREHTRLTTVSQSDGRTLVRGIGAVVGLSPSWCDGNGRLQPAHVEYRPLGHGGHRRGNTVQLEPGEPPAELRDAEVELGLTRGTWWIASAPYWYRDASGQERMRAEHCWVRGGRWAVTPASERPTTPAPAPTDAEIEEIREHDAREMFLVMGPSGLEKIWAKGEFVK